MKNYRDQESIRAILQQAKKSGKTIVATNGCFDLLHVGHLRNLEASKNLGDILVVGLNSDTSVQALKGSGRPINNESDRAELLLGLKPVDHVVIFDELNACTFLKLVEPDIYTKGGDYTSSDLQKWPEYRIAQELNCRIEIIKLVEGKSSTKLIANLVDKSCEV